MLSGQLKLLRTTTVIAIGAAGAIHLVLVPEHFSHSPAHGLFFAAAGLLEFAWALLYWRRPSARMSALGFALAGGLVVLWALTRFATPPFEETPAPVDLTGVICKLLEIAGLAALGLLLAAEQDTSLPQRSAGWIAAWALLLSLGSGLLIYLGGMAAEPLFPGLAGSGHMPEAGDVHAGEDEEHGHGQEQVQHQGTEAVVLESGYLVSEAWARPGPAGGNSAAYFKLNNPTPEEDRLLGASSPVARSAELHLSEVDANGVASMRRQDFIDIPAGWQLAFAPGGLHVMLIGLTQDLDVGDTFPLALEFEHAGTLEIQVEVLKR